MVVKLLSYLHDTVRFQHHTLMARQNVGRVHDARFSTPSESPPILGEKGRACTFVYVLTQTCSLKRAHSNVLIQTCSFKRARSEDARSVRISLPKTGEGSGGVDIEEPPFAEAPYTHGVPVISLFACSILFLSRAKTCFSPRSRALT